MTQKDRISIVFVLPNFAGGGAERVALNLMAGLHAANVAVSLVVFENQGPLMSMVPKGVPVAALGKPRLRTALRPLMSHLRKQRPDAVFSTLGYVNLGLLAFRRLLSPRTRVIVREANLPSISLPGSAYPGVMKLAYRHLYPRADAVIVSSRRMADEFLRDFGLNRSRLYTLPNPVDIRRIRALASPVRRHPGPGLRLVAAGRLARQKGFDRLIDMLPYLPNDAHVTILGDGPLLSRLTARARSAGVQSKVDFLGFAANPYPWFAGADAFLMPSRWEGLPNAALESLACGTPVIATPESGGIAEIRDAAVDGAVSIAQANHLFTTLIRQVTISDSPSLRPGLMPKQYRLETVVCDFLGLLDEVVRRRQQPEPSPGHIS